MAVHVIDLFKIIQIDHQDCHGFAFGSGLMQQFLGRWVQAAAIVARSQRVDLGEHAGLVFGLTAFTDLAGQFAVTAIPKDQQRDIEQDGRAQRIGRLGAVAQHGFDNLRKQRAAGADKQDRRCDHDPGGDNIAISPPQRAVPAYIPTTRILHQRLQPAYSCATLAAEYPVSL